MDVEGFAETAHLENLMHLTCDRAKCELAQLAALLLGGEQDDPQSRTGDIAQLGEIEQDCVLAGLDAGDQGSSKFFGIAAIDPAPRQISATGISSVPCFRMNAFWASENRDGFIVFRSSPAREQTRKTLPKNDPTFRA
jgi:hypothetical protein